MGRPSVYTNKCDEVGSVKVYFCIWPVDVTLTPVCTGERTTRECRSGVRYAVAGDAPLAPPLGTNRNQQRRGSVSAGDCN